MDNELRNEILSLLYYAEEYLFYGKQEYKESLDYLNTLIKNIDSYHNEELKYIIINWIIHNKVYKTLCPNGIHVYFNNKLYSNILYLLTIRENTRYDLNNNPVTLHIYFDNRYDSVEFNELNKIENISNIFHKKYIHLFNNQWFTNDLYDYCMSNNYNIIYELEDMNQIQNNKPYSHISIKDENINELEHIIKLCSETNMKKLYITPEIRLSSNKNLYRKNIDELSIKYTNKDFYVIFNDYLQGQHIGIDRDNNIFLKENTENFYFKTNNSLEQIIETIKMRMISTKIIHEKCMNCEDNILCALGISDKDCEDKIL